MNIKSRSVCVGVVIMTQKLERKKKENEKIMLGFLFTDQITVYILRFTETFSFIIKYDHT